MDRSRLAARLAALAFEAVLCFGILASTWLVLDELLGDDWPRGLVRMDADGGRWLAGEIGNDDVPERVVIPDPLPRGTPHP
jgi:hypothetical protein